MLLTSVVYAEDDASTSPEAGTRTYGQNHKDMVLATCIASAYKGDKQASARPPSSWITRWIKCSLAMVVGGSTKG